LSYTYEQSNKRGIIPTYAFVISKNDRIDLFIATQEFVCKNYLGIDTIENYMKTYTSKKDSGNTKSFNTSLKNREKWRTLECQDEGIIYAATLSLVRE